MAARPPQQARSRARRDVILDAAEELLQTADIENLSLSDVGLQAGMSKASVHYHFSTIAAIQLELGRRHDLNIRKTLTNKALSNDQASFLNWQAWMQYVAGVSRDYLNANRAACETLLGPLMTRQNRLATMRDNAELGRAHLHNLKRLFDVPNEELLMQVLPYYGEILDVFWSGAYLSRGTIDDEVFEESVRAGIGYLRHFLPDVLPLRKSTEEEVEATSGDAEPAQTQAGVIPDRE